MHLMTLYVTCFHLLSTWTLFSLFSCTNGSEWKVVCCRCVLAFFYFITCIGSTTGNHHRTVEVCVSEKCPLSLGLCLCVSVFYVLILEREVKWTLPLFSKKRPSIATSSFWHTMHAHNTHTHTHTHTIYVLIWHCVVTMMCACVWVENGLV